ncbi:MAG: cyclopropane-fatty-acyl-phospholipid synthase family protein [Pseudomonadota bacterium]
MSHQPLNQHALNVLNQLKGAQLIFQGEISAVVGDPNAELTCTLQIHDTQLFKLIAKDGVLGASEAYIQGFWDVDDLVCLVRILVRNRDLLDSMNSKPLVKASQLVMRAWHNRRKNSKQGSQRNIADHYDLSNEFFQLFLDDNMMYSCAMFNKHALNTMSLNADTLERASDEKLNTICQKLKLTASDHVIEIGTGWGGFALYAAKHYGCYVTTTTISEQQYQLAKQRVQDAGLSNKITLLKQDYRELTGSFDKLVSIEMIEAVGHHYLSTYFKTCQHLLKPDGLALIQAITIEDTRYEKALKTVDYIKRYVFPGSFIPCSSVIVNHASDAGLKLMDYNDIGLSYALTIKHWRTRFFDKLDQVRALGFDERFIRMWEFYLCYCEGGFLEETISDAHLLFKNNMRSNA